MIREMIAASQEPMPRDHVEICQRVFYQVCAKRGFRTDDKRRDLATSIIHLHEQGITTENSLMRLLV
jgi:hypothetical protein